MQPPVYCYLILVPLMYICSCRPALQAPRDLFPEHATEMGTGAEKSGPTVPVVVYLDATPSMKGFARPDSHIAVFLRHLEMSLVQGGRARPAYTRFGTDVRPYKVADTIYQDVSQLKFYDATDAGTDTHIEKVIAHTAKPGLHVIVTDLFEANENITEILRAFHEHVMVRSHVLAICGMRSPFSGRIYDVGPERLSFPYTGIEGARRRPFYALLIGTGTDVTAVLDQLTANAEIIDSKNVLLLGPSLLRQPLTISGMQEIERNNANEDAGIAPAGSSDVVAYRVTQSPVSCRLALPFRQSRYAPAIEVTQLPPIATRIKTAAGGDDVENGDIPGSDSIRLNPGKEGTVELAFSLGFGNVSSGQVYAFSLTPHVTREAVRLPDFVHEWSTSFSGRPSGVDGSKTLNLHDLIGGMWQIVATRSKPRLGVLYVYFKT